MPRCPAAKRAYTVVEASRRDEFVNAIEFDGPSVPHRTFEPPRWFFYDDWRGQVVGPDPLFDALHGMFRGPGHWRIVVGCPNADTLDGVTFNDVEWALVEFNNASDAVKARLLLEEEHVGL